MKPIRMWAEMSADGALVNMSDGTPFLWLQEPSKEFFAESNKTVEVILALADKPLDDLERSDLLAESARVVAGYENLSTLVKKMQEIVPSRKPDVAEVAKWLFDNFPHDPNAVSTAPYWVNKAKALLTLLDYEEPKEDKIVERIGVPYAVNCDVCNEGTPTPCKTEIEAIENKCWRFNSNRAEG